MESSSRASSSVGRRPHQLANHKLANLMGTVIGLLTLTVPLFAIAQFSSITPQPWQAPTPLIPNVR